MARCADPRAISVKVRLADGSVYDGTGSLNFVDVEVEAATDTVTLRAQLPNPDRMLIDGQLVAAIVEATIPQTALLIPTEALHIDQGGQFALVVNSDNKVQVRLREIGRAYGGGGSTSSAGERGG